MSISVRVSTINDINALVEVECSDVETWHHYSYKGRGEPAKYKELTPLERMMHGGPWMDRLELAKYWRRIERLGIIPLVAELDEKIVGHLDVIFSDELPLGSFLYLDVLKVHKAYRRRGVARALIQEAERIAGDRKVIFMLVSPQEYDGPSGLTYRNCGFEKAFDTYDVEMVVGNTVISQEIRLTPITLAKEPPVKTHSMVCGWYNVSLKMWDNIANPNLELTRFLHERQLATSLLVEGNTYFLCIWSRLFDPTTGSIALWAPEPLDKKELKQVFQACRALASCMGMEKIATRTIEQYVLMLGDVDFKTKIKGEPYLIKKLVL
ncbi:MAG: GNAT family N-acetyltransferase [Thermoproteota archaeon]